MKTNTTTRTMNLPVKLTRDEVFTRGAQIASAKDEHTKAQAELEAAAEAWKATRSDLEKRIGALELDLRRLARVIGSQTEYRDVEVVDEPDFKFGIMRTVRLDSGELVNTRGLTEAERQRSLFKAADVPKAVATGDLVVALDSALKAEAVAALGGTKAARKRAASRS